VVIGPHVGRLRGTQRVVHAIAPRAIEADAIRGIGRQEGRRLAVEQARHVVGVRRVPAQEAMVPERPEITGLRAGCPARLLQRLVEVERLCPFPLLAGLQRSQQLLDLILAEA
jgi:hypothetical protein